jgi:hypothetical protein
VGKENANIGSVEEDTGSEAQAVHEDMPRLWCKERGDRDKV